MMIFFFFGGGGGGRGKFHTNDKLLGSLTSNILALIFGIVLEHRCIIKTEKVKKDIYQ